VTIVW
jgi:hypothetical protein